MVLSLSFVAIPSNRGCCPTNDSGAGEAPEATSRNPLKSGLLSYHKGGGRDEHK